MVARANPNNFTILSAAVSRFSMMINCLYNFANQLQEQAKEQAANTERLAGEVASLREALQELITKVTTK